MAKNHKLGSQLATFFDIVDFTAERIENEKKILPSLLNICLMFKLLCWYNPGENDQNTV